MRTLVFLFFVFFLGSLCYAQSDSQQDLQSYKSYLIIYMKKFETQQGSNNYPQYGYAQRAGVSRTLAGKKMGYSKFNDFPTKDDRNWVKGQVIQNVGVLAQALAQTAGTAYAFDSASQLRSNASQLIATGDPTFKQIGGQLNQEASQVEAGNQVGAQNTANGISQTPLPVVSQGYQPGSQESAFVQALSNTFSMIISSVTGVIGLAAASQFLQLLGIGGQGGGAFGNIIASGTTGLINGQPPGNVATNSSSSAVYAGGGLVQTKINTNTAPIVQPPPVNGSSSGGVPAP